MIEKYLQTIGSPRKISQRVVIPSRIPTMEKLTYTGKGDTYGAYLILMTLTLRSKYLKLFEEGLEKKEVKRFQISECEWETPSHTFFP